MFNKVSFSLILLLMGGILFVSCNKKDTKPCFSSELSGQYTGELTSSNPPLVEGNSQVTVSVDGCQTLRVQVRSTNRTYNINRISTANGTDYTALTSDNKEATISYSAASKQIEITIEPDITFRGNKP